MIFNLRRIRDLISMEIVKKIDNLIEEKIEATKKTDGMVCPMCNIIQGEPKHGFKKFYCNHTTECIDSKIKLDSSIIVE